MIIPTGFNQNRLGFCVFPGVGAGEIVHQPLHLRAVGRDVVLGDPAGELKAVPALPAGHAQGRDVQIAVIHAVPALSADAVLLLGIEGTEQLHVDLPGPVRVVHGHLLVGEDPLIVRFMVARILFAVQHGGHAVIDHAARLRIPSHARAKVIWRTACASAPFSQARPESCSRITGIR